MSENTTITDQKPISPLVYMRRQEIFTKSAEWSQLPKEDKDELLRWASEEMSILGIPIKA